MHISNIPFRGKVLLIVAVSLVGIALAIGLGLDTLRKELGKDRSDKTAQLVEVVHGVISHYVALAASGQMTAAEAQAAAVATVKTLRYSGNEYFWINDMQGHVVMHPIKPELDGKDVLDLKDPTGKLLFTAFIDTVRVSKAGFVEYLWPKPGFAEPVRKLSYVKGIEEWQWVVGSGIYLDDVDAAFWAAAMKQATGVGLVVALMLLVSYRVGDNMVRAMAHVSSGMTRLAAGDTTGESGDGHRKDEIGGMLRALAVFRENVVKVAQLREEKETTRALAEQERTQVMMFMADTFQGFVGNILGDLNAQNDEMQISATSLNHVAEQVSAKSIAVSSASEAATRNVEGVASAAEQLAASTSEIRRQVDHSADLAREAVENASNSNRIVSSLAGAAGRIGEVLRLISGIANQTNLLALNATIEAARAGEAGKGFAVVAGEVKKLANQTAGATEEIAEQIASIQSAASDAVHAIETIAVVIGDINRATTVIAAAVDAQGSATYGIVRTMQQAAQDTRTVSCNIADVLDVAKMAGSEAEGVLSVASRLTSHTNVLTGEFESFLVKMREQTNSLGAVAGGEELF